MQPRRRHFFTNRALEYFVVLALILLIVAAGSTLFRSALAEARDAERLGHVASLRLALELYHTDHGGYPAVGWANSAAASWDAFAGHLAPYLRDMPRDPRNDPRGPVERTGAFNYSYYAGDDPGMIGGRDDYVIVFRLENPERATLARETSDIVNWRNMPAFAEFPDVDGLFVVRAP